MINQGDWLREIISIAEHMTLDDYESHIKYFQEEGISIELLKKTIFQEHKNPTDEAMETALSKYFRDYYEDEAFKDKLALALYELKQTNLDKFNEFKQKYVK